MRVCQFDHHNCNSKHQLNESLNQAISDSEDNQIPKPSIKSKLAKPILSSNLRSNDQLKSMRNLDIDREKEIEKMIELELQNERDLLKTTRKTRSRSSRSIPESVNNLGSLTRGRSRSRVADASRRTDTPSRSKKNVESSVLLTQDESPQPIKTKFKEISPAHVKFQIEEADSNPSSPQVNEVSIEIPKVKENIIEEKKVRPRTLREIKDQSLMNPAIILDKLDNLSIYRYHYKGGGKKMAMGPLPQDWHQAFPTDKDIEVLDPQDMSAICLVSIKALSQMVSTIWQTVLSINERLETLEQAYHDDNQDPTSNQSS